MFTVIFAEKETIKLFEETKMFFGPLLDTGNIAFCEWEKEENSLDKMAPELYRIIEFQEEWRALIICNDHIQRLNPFDYSQYEESFDYDGIKDCEYFENRRSKRFEAYEKAISNPLLKLTTALCGMPKLKSVIEDKVVYDEILSGNMSIFEYMLTCQLKALDCNEVAAKIEKYQRDQLKKFVKDEEVDMLIDLVKDGNASGIIQLIQDADTLEFIKYIGNDPIYYDPEYTDCLIGNTKKANLLNTLVKDFSMKDKLPFEVICLSPRTFDFETVEQDVKWKNKDEREYSRFADFNLYSNKLKYLLFDVLPQEHIQYKFDHIKLMCLLLLVANNDLPQGLLHAGQVYRANVNFNSDIIAKICEKYIGKLKSTKLLLKEIEIQFERENVLSVDDNMAHRLFESDINIPVEFNSSFNINELYSEYKRIGLSTDCPEHEDIYWDKQYRNISKKFVKFLREPIRAIKTAVSDEFHTNCVVDDDRALVLNATQLEDVEYHLFEEEQKMIDATTTYMFNVQKFNEQIQEADEEIRKGIAQRITRNKTILVGLTAFLAYLIGFLPLIFSNLNTMKTFLFSLSVTGITLGTFLLAGFVQLFLFRRKLVKQFKHFNDVMSGIYHTIISTLAKFSTYLSHACNVMRDFSVLKRRDSALMRLKKILRYHDMRIDEQIQKVYDMFSKYINLDNIEVAEDDVYEFDFTVVREYDFDMPSIYSKRRIEFLQPGNEITVPIDYIESITLIREELYD